MSYFGSANDMAGFTGGIVAALAFLIALSSLFVLVPVILLVANRAEPDQRGMRPQSVYLSGMSFVTLQLTFAGSVLHHVAVLRHCPT